MKARRGFARNRSSQNPFPKARRLAGVTSPAGEFDYTLGGAGAASSALVKKLLLPNGAFIANDYDGNARLTATRLESSVQNYTNGVFDSYVYGYNQANQRTNVVRLLGDSVAYTYDNAGELLTAKGRCYELF